MLQWDEAKHPRLPRGVPGGGRFAGLHSLVNGLVMGTHWTFPETGMTLHHDGRSTDRGLTSVYRLTSPNGKTLAETADPKEAVGVLIRFNADGHHSSPPQTSGNKGPVPQATVDAIVAKKRRERRGDNVEDAFDQLLAEQLEARGAASVTPHDRMKLKGILAHYAKMAHPFTACVRDNTKRFGPERAEKVCATLKDVIRGTTKWRKGGNHRSADEVDAPEELDEAGQSALSALTEEDLHGLIASFEEMEESGPQDVEQVRSAVFEYRSAPFKDVDVTARRFRGYAAVYETEADLGEFTEEMRRGSLRQVLQTEPEVPMLYNHNAMDPPLARSPGTMTLKEDGRGLLVDATLPTHARAQEILEGVERGDIAGMSFGFVCGQGNSEIQMRSGKPHRTITNLKKLLDVSPTHNPAYAETTAEVRSMVQQATFLDPSQTEPSGDRPQIGLDSGDGSEQVDMNVTVPESSDSDEQRAGVDEHNARMAARRRMLVRQAAELGLSKPTF